MMTKVWGPPGWLFLHCVAFGYPVKVDKWDYKDNLKRMEYRNFFKNLGHILLTPGKSGDSNSLSLKYFNAICSSTFFTLFFQISKFILDPLIVFFFVIY